MCNLKDAFLHLLYELLALSEDECFAGEVFYGNADHGFDGVPVVAHFLFELVDAG